jgi:hypothetical protein
MPGRPGTRLRQEGHHMKATLTREFRVEWDRRTMKRRQIYVVRVEDGRRKIVRTKAAAREWCEDMGIEVSA